MERVETGCCCDSLVEEQRQQSKLKIIMNNSVANAKFATFMIFNLVEIVW